MLIALNKPMNRLSQFTDEGQWQGLSGLGLPKGVYPAGRLDRDSEGLLLLTDDGGLQARISSPKFKMAKTYWVLVEGTPSPAALEALKLGVTLKDGPTKRAEVAVIAPPEGLWQRDPPVRLRKAPDTWLSLTIREGRNRQVRRMTAAVGHPTLRLIRARIGPWELEGLLPGKWRVLEPGPAPAAMAKAAKRGGASPGAGRGAKPGQKLGQKPAQKPGQKPGQKSGQHPAPKPPRRGRTPGRD